MKKQNVYRKIPNFDYSLTYEKLRSSNLFSSVDQTEKGHIQARYKDADILVQISPYGILVIWYSNDDDKKNCYYDLEKIVGVHLEPTEANVWKIPYPPPSTFSIPFCNERVRYFAPTLILLALIPFLMLSFLVLAVITTIINYPFILVSLGLLLLNYNLQKNKDETELKSLKTSNSIIRKI